MSVLLAFVALLVAVVMPAIVSVVNAVKTEVSRWWRPPDLIVWGFAIVVGIAASFATAYVLTLYPLAGVIAPNDDTVLALIGVLLGLGASGIVDLTKMLTLQRE